MAQYPILLIYHNYFAFFKDYIYFQRQGERERNRGRETSLCGCSSHIPHWGPGPHPRHVPWLGIEPVTLCFAVQCSIHWATPAKAHNCFSTWIYWHVECIQFFSHMYAIMNLFIHLSFCILQNISLACMSITNAAWSKIKHSFTGLTLYISHILFQLEVPPIRICDNFVSTNIMAF